MGCRSSVVRALVAKTSGPGFDSLATTKFFHTFYLCFSLTLECDKVSILVFMTGEIKTI